MLRKLMVTGIAMSALNTGFCQDSSGKSSLKLSGWGDLYYKYDFGKSASNNLTSFTNSHNSFELGMASVRLDYITPKVQVVADLGVGKRAQEFSYNDEGILTAIKQLYVSYTPNSWLKLTAGEWATHIGYEMVDAPLNRNYSMSYMFTNGPFFHTGIKAEVSFGKSVFMVGIANPTDFKYVPSGVLNNKVFLAQYSVAPSETFKVYVNMVSGDNTDTSKTTQYDLVLTKKIGQKLNLAYNGTLNRTQLYLGDKKFDQTKTWWGSALYLSYDLSSKFSLNLREEYFNDGDQLKMFGSMPRGGSVFASTLSANIKAENLTIIPEFRLDRANDALFTTKESNPTKTAASFLVAAIYQF